MDRFDDEIEQLAEAVIGAAIEVHRHLGPGHPESVYCSALEYEFELRSIGNQREHHYRVRYKGKDVGEGRLDFWVGKRLTVEVKAVEELSPVHSGQVVAYLSQKDEPVGLLINFNVPVLRRGLRRIVRSKSKGNSPDVK
ncbi:MAG: GxxExxY protein [Planctomycetes bacterium]|nr:GxxExxY protein [Planctomycetota bacterium]